MIANKKPVVFSVLDIASNNNGNVSFFLMRAINRVANAPIPAASVGLNIPAYIPPMTMKNNARIQIVDFNDTNFSFQLTF